MLIKQDTLLQVIEIPFVVDNTSVLVGDVMAMATVVDVFRIVVPEEVMLVKETDDILMLAAEVDKEVFEKGVGEELIFVVVVGVTVVLIAFDGILIDLGVTVLGCRV